MRRRDERGEVGVVGSVLITVALLAGLRVIGFDAIGYLDAAADWMIEFVGDLLGILFDEPPRRR